MSQDSDYSQAAVTAARLPVPAPAGSGWLLSPWLDLLCVVNVLWPVLVLCQHDAGFAGRPAVQFWQMYFVTTPHRWITLVLVFGDRQRWNQRPLLFGGLAVLAVVLCTGIRLATGTLTCLLAIDYVWNAWHFAAQHHGVYRIYGRLQARPAPSPGPLQLLPMLQLEKWALRTFLMYVILRVALSTVGGITWLPQLEPVDWLLAIIPVGLLLRDLWLQPHPQTGRILYLSSVAALYLSMLWAVQVRRPDLVLSLATASAMFHALEYFAVVGWHVQQRYRAAGEELGLLSWLAPRWGLTIACFTGILGAGGWLLDQGWLEIWLLINVVVAFLHYGYDGLIWKSPRIPPALRKL